MESRVSVWVEKLLWVPSRSDKASGKVAGRGFQSRVGFGHPITALVTAFNIPNKIAIKVECDTFSLHRIRINKVI